MATTTSMIAQLKVRFGDAAGDIVTSANWLAYLQDAYDEGNRHSPFWPFEETIDTSVTIAVGANSASLETEQPGAWRVTSVLNTTDNYPLRPLTRKPADDYPTLSADKGSPESYRLVKNTLEVYPYPDHAVVLRVELYVPPAALVDDTTTPVWPPEFHRVLQDGALALAYEDDGNEKFSDRHRGRFMEGLAKMEEALLGGLRSESYPQILDPGW